MGKLSEWIKNKEDLKIAIMDYDEAMLDVINFSAFYKAKHWEVLKRNTDKREILEREFGDRLYNYLWTPKIGELVIILYLEDLKGIHPTIYWVNKLLKRTKDQYSSTFKAVKKLEKLDIVYIEAVKNSSRKEKLIFINKQVVRVYGDDEFRKMMLDEWDTDAKEYIKMKLSKLLKEKENFEENIKMIKKGRRLKNG